MFQGIDTKSLVWWYWLVTVFALMYGLIISAEGILFAIGLSAWQGVHLAFKQANLFAFPVQVRFWYMFFLIFAFLANSSFIFIVMIIGTWAQLIVGYCGMARFVSLHPWNLSQPYSLKLLKDTIFSPPRPGSIQQTLHESHVDNV